MAYLSRQGGKGFMLYFCGQFIAVIYSEVFPWWPIFWFTDERMWDYHLITFLTGQTIWQFLTVFGKKKYPDLYFVNLFRMSGVGLSPHHLLHMSHNLTTSNSVWSDNDTFWHRSMCLGTGGEIGEPLAQPITITIAIHNLTTFISLWKTPNDTFWKRKDPIAPHIPPGRLPKTQFLIKFTLYWFLLCAPALVRCNILSNEYQQHSENWCKNGHKKKNYS